MDPAQARCGGCDVEPLLWRVAEASQRLVAHAAVYGADRADAGRLVLHGPAEYERLFLNPLEAAFSDLCAAVTRMNGRMAEALAETA